MRVLISGIVGAAAPAAAWMAIEHNTKQEFSWMAVAVGIVTGLAVHWAAGAGSSGSYARGALAAVLALVASITCPQVYAKVMQKINVGPAVVAVESGEPAEVEAAGESAEGAADATQPLMLPRGGGAAGDLGGAMEVSVKRGMSQWDMLWLSLSALSAYLIGKGRDNPVVVEAETDETPAEPAEGEPA